MLGEPINESDVCLYIRIRSRGTPFSQRVVDPNKAEKVKLIYRGCENLKIKCDSQIVIYKLI